MTKQLLHLVMGGRVVDPQGVEFQDLNDIHIVGIYPNYAAAEEACRRAIAGHLLTTKPAEPLNLTRNSLDFCQTSAQGWVVETPPQGGRPV